jgi:hypothetical protein
MPGRLMSEAGARGAWHSAGAVWQAVATECLLALAGVANMTAKAMKIMTKIRDMTVCPTGASW